MITNQTNNKLYEIGLKYQEGLYSEQEIKEFTEIFKDEEIKLKFLVNRTRYFNTFDSLIPIIEIFISSEIIQNFILTMAYSTLYDLLKQLLLKIKDITSSKKIFKIQSNMEPKPQEKNIQIRIGELRVILPTEINDSKFEYFTDKIFETISSIDIKKEQYLSFDIPEDKLKIYSFQEFINKNKDA